MTKDFEPNPETIAQVAQRIGPFVRRTPILHVEARDLELDGAPIVFKLEQLQRAGSFKTRGAFANLLMRETPAAGVVAASGGNHGAAAAYAAMERKIPATIFIPTISNPAKAERIRQYVDRPRSRLLFRAPMCRSRMSVSPSSSVAPTPTS